MPNPLVVPVVGGMRVARLLQVAGDQLNLAGVDQATLEAELLLGACLGKNRTSLFLSACEEVDDECVKRFHAFLARRLRREPLAYILGEKEFWSLSFLVTPDVLIPRPETEFLLETVLQKRNVNVRPGLVLDLCAGSGVIAIVLALELGCNVLALDLSAPALAVVRENAHRHRVSHLLSLVRSDLLSALADRQQVSLFVSNPPYVSEFEIHNHLLQPEVMSFEPHLALNGGARGLEVIARICPRLPRLLSPGGDCFMEIGADHGAKVVQLLAESDSEGRFGSIDVLQDYAGRDRVVHVRMKDR